MKYLLVLLIALISIGCHPVEGFVNGQFAGDGATNALNQMRLIAKNAAIVYDPTLTEEDFQAYIAEKEFEYRRFVALFKLYAALTASADQDVGAVLEYNLSIKQSARDLDEIQERYYTENSVE